jgi:hypothetical protein
MTAQPAPTDFAEQPTSLSDLHYRLGKLVEQLPIQALPSDRPPTNAGKHYFADIEPVGFVNTGTIERLEEWAADHLATLSPERRAELEREWK